MQELRNEGHGHRHNAVDNMCRKKLGLCLLISTPVASPYAYGVLILYCLACAAAHTRHPGRGVEVEKRPRGRAANGCIARQHVECGVYAYVI